MRLFKVVLRRLVPRTVEQFATITIPARTNEAARIEATRVLREVAQGLTNLKWKDQYNWDEEEPGDGEIWEVRKIRKGRAVTCNE